MPIAIKKRSEKKVATEEDIKEAAIDIRERLKQRQRILIYSAGIFVAIILVVIFLVIHVKANKERALELEYEGYKLYYEDYDAQMARNSAPLRFISPADRYKEALEIFKKSYEKRKKPHVLLYIGNCYYKLGNYSEAIKTFKELINQFPDSKIISLSHYKMAMAYIRKEDKDNALNVLESLLSIKDGAFHDMALMEKGKILELLGQNERAKSKYKELMDRFPESPLFSEAKIRMESI